MWPYNQRTKLRAVVTSAPLAGVTPHTLRRTVGTVVAHQAGLDPARDLLGHRDPSITARHYVADTDVAVDVRHVLDQIFEGRLNGTISTAGGIADDGDGAVP